ncbi:MAG: sensor histidine kinase [Christensenellales bacterium]|jgi:two-component system sensor histidine kinase YesM
MKKKAVEKNRTHSLASHYAGLLILCVLFLSVVLAVSVFVFPYQQSMSLQRQHYTNYINNAHVTISNHLKSITDAVKLIEDSSTIADNMRFYDKNPRERIEPEDIQYDIDAPISYVDIFSNRMISGIGIFTQGRLAYFTYSHQAMDISLSRCADVYERYPEGSGAEGFVPAPQTSGYIYWVEDFTHIYNGISCGKIVIETLPIPTATVATHQSAVFDYQLDLHTYPDTSYYLYDKNGVILFSDRQEYVGQRIKNALPQKLLTAQNDIVSTSDEYEISKNYYNKQHLNSLIITPKAGVISSALDTFVYFMITVVGTVTLILLVAALFFQRITEPIKGLNQYVKFAQEHPLSRPAFAPKYQDIESICALVNQHIDRIKGLDQALASAQMEVKDAEIHSLQSQINPHFLFNILDIVGWKAEQSDLKEVSDMINQLGEMLHSDVLLSGQERVTIRQEIHYIKNYLSLQQIRYNHNFTYEIDVSESILNTHYVPKLSIQPIVENSIVHGIQPSGKRGHVQISIYERGEDLICKVTDDGVGFDSQNIFEKQPEEPPQNRGKTHRIALQNIRQRIHMLYGEPYGIVIHSIPGEGTTVIVTLPIDLKKP